MLFKRQDTSHGIKMFPISREIQTGKPQELLHIRHTYMTLLRTAKQFGENLIWMQKAVIIPLVTYKGEKCEFL